VRHWVVERVFARMQWKRRTLARRECDPANFHGFAQLQSSTILLEAT
jgi:hypothetical protein